MTKGIKKPVYKAIDKVSKEIAFNASSGDLYARGLASEGYAGGYRQALEDVLLLLNGVKPNTRNYWED